MGLYGVCWQQCPFPFNGRAEVILSYGSMAGHCGQYAGMRRLVSVLKAPTGGISDG